MFGHFASFETSSAISAFGNYLSNQMGQKSAGVTLGRDDAIR